MADMMTFPDTVEEFMEKYKLVDTKQVYTNGAELVPIFRMKQWFEHESAVRAKNTVASNDCISRQSAIAVADYADYTGLAIEDVKKVTGEVVKGLKQLPFAQPESCEDKLKEIADVLSEKMGYMNMCPNERDIILGYLGIERPSENHCNSDCWNEKCESYHYETRKQLEPCDLCSNLEKGDTLYQHSDWDGGIGFDYIWNIQFCPKCGRRLEE